jgi:hypothetical protein
MGWRDWFGPKPKNDAASSIEYKRFLDALEYAHKHDMTVAEAYRHFGHETDVVRIMVRYNTHALKRLKSLGSNDVEDMQQSLGEGGHPFIQLTGGTGASISTLARRIASLTLISADLPENMEGDQFSLARLWAEMATRHYTELAALAASAQIPLDREQTARLYRQVCFFYDGLWYYNLHQRILDAGRIPREQMSRYVEEFRESTMVSCVMHENVPIRPEDMSIFGQPEEQQEDYEFYVHGKLSKPYYEGDYARVLGYIGVERDGTTRESTARLHFRTCQVLDLSHRMSSIEMNWWWLLQFELVHENIGTIITKVVPIP